MNRSLLLAFAVCFSCNSAAIADDYLLRIDTIGYIDKPASEKDPKETNIRSIEVVARPESAFHSKVSTGNQTLFVVGKLLRAENGGYHVQIRYVHSIDTGISVATEDGGRKPVPDTTEIQTTTTVAVGDTVTIGGFETNASGSGKPDRHSKTRCVLVLAKYEPPIE